MNTQPTRRMFLATGALTAACPAALDAGGKLPERPPPPKFRLGIVTYNIAADWDIDTILAVCKRVGLSAVELRTTHKHGVEPALARERRGDVKKRFEDAGVQLWGLGTVCEFHSPEKAVVEKNIETCKQFLQLSADLGAVGVKVRPDGLPPDVPEVKTLAQIGAALAVCGKAAADLHQEIWVEVHGKGTALPANMKRIMEHCGHKCVGITWNSNDTDLKNGSIAEGFDALQPWIKSCHINELHSRYPWRELFLRLRQMAYDRVTLAEIPAMPDAAAGERLLRYYRALWQELCRE